MFYRYLRTTTTCQCKLPVDEEKASFSTLSKMRKPFSLNAVGQTAFLISEILVTKGRELFVEKCNWAFQPPMTP